MGQMKGMEFIYIFIGALIGLMFSGEIGNLATSAVENSTGIAASIYGYLPAFYALCCLGLMAGSIYKFFKK